MHVAEATMVHEDSSKANSLSELNDIDSLVAVYRPRLLRYVTFSIGDQDLAESITQDCLLKAYNARGSFRGDCAVSTWLFGIANNLVRDQLRRKKFHFWRQAQTNALDVSEMAFLLPNHQASPEDRILAVERLRQVVKIVESLSPKQRQVFILKFAEELDLDEISRCTGMTVNTVKTHLHRAIYSVRKALGVRS